MVPVILSGGSGTRLWPVSQKHSPKQFLRLFSDYSLFQETLLRLPEAGMTEPLVVCNESHRFAVAEHCRELDIKPQAILLEPLGRNTAPAIALAALSLLKHGIDDPMLVLPADHQMEGGADFHNIIKLAEPYARKGKLVTFGITPQYAETAYGYICLGKPEGDCFSIDAFVEKPNQKKAEQFISEGNHLWNSGIFMMKPSSYLNELLSMEPDTYEACSQSLDRAVEDMDFLRVDHDSFANAGNISVDCAVMEKTNKGCVIPFQGVWSDIGSWQSIKANTPSDSQGNAVQGNVLHHSCTDTFIRSEKLIMAVGLDNMIVVDTNDGVLVLAADKADQLAPVLARLEQMDKSER
ncbi:mannose-1-phosphate guanylyltransferase/mannose-6-phosphate isomerase [Endozoicomonas sp. (ex Bugula neritina AB1)]|nr:mannose-1-phosphate guanylyltransferase/mannose-6-phosphate isomerase [Endozoicomonas sp. (ex Bugula neritina AB1)]